MVQNSAFLSAVGMFVCFVSACRVSKYRWVLLLWNALFLYHQFRRVWHSFWISYSLV